MSFHRRAFFFLAALLVLAELSLSQSPSPSPSHAPTTKKKAPAYVPVAAPAPTEAEPTAPTPTTETTDCTTLLFGAADCLSYVQEGSNLTEPDKACCPELATLVNTNPICLCQLLTKGNSLGIALDMTRALALPGACKVDTPDPGLCALVNGSPTDAPSSSPSDGLSPTGAVLPPTSVNNENGAVAHTAGPTSSFIVALTAVAAITWNMV